MLTALSSGQLRGGASIRDDVRVIMRFDGYRGRYLMRCHNLEHEDYDMMMRFDVV